MKKNRRLFNIIIACSILILMAFVYLNFFKKNTISINNPILPEEIVFVKSSDDILDAGVVFNAKNELAKHIAVIWIHGWGVNFYSPTYISIGRAIAEKGYTCITVNSRMHDLGNVEGYRGDIRLRGGGYWGIAGDEVRDIAAWIDFARSQGFDKVILVGHSAGWAAVRIYQTEMRDSRVAGLVLASGGVGPDIPPIDTSQYLKAVQLLSENKGDELIKDSNRSFPSYLSAATFMDIVNTPREEKDFFGFITPNAGITKINCPILAFYGTNNDVGNKRDLDSLQSNLARQSLKVKLTTTMIENADHMYTGEETQVADVITNWMDNILKDEKNK
jgi:pimeloyl-ACP methyl ester carboxylesterase